jgi:hypothetical protein
MRERGDGVRGVPRRRAVAVEEHGHGHAGRGGAPQRPEREAICGAGGDELEAGGREIGGARVDGAGIDEPALDGIERAHAEEIEAEQDAADPGDGL